MHQMKKTSLAIRFHLIRCQTCKQILHISPVESSLARLVNTAHDTYKAMQALQQIVNGATADLKQVIIQESAKHN